MVGQRLAAAALGVIGVVAASGAVAQSLSREISDCARGPCVLLAAAPSFSNLRFSLGAGGQPVDEATGKGIDYEVRLVAIEPFKTTPYGPGVNEMGLGSVRSAQVHLALTPLPGFDPGNPNPGPEPSVTAELFATLGHRRMPSGVAAQPGKVDRFSYALGLGFSLSPDQKASFAGRLKYGASLQYRRQFLPDATNGAPVRVDNLIVQAGVSGGWKRAFGLASGLSFGLSAAYDVKTKVPGAELSVSTRVMATPLITVGVRGWVQGRASDPRTQDKRWDFAPTLAVKF